MRPVLDIVVDPKRTPAGLVREIHAACREHPGNHPVLIHAGDLILPLNVGADVWDPDLIAEIEALIGDAGFIA